jgi:hypothetical protein
MKENGKGTMTFRSKNKYVGDFVNGMQEGTGVFAFATGKTYNGQWRGGDFEGRGTMERVGY